MQKTCYNVVGVMSGTSLDGVDLAFVEFRREQKWNFKILSAETVAYSTVWQTKLSHALHLGQAELDVLDSAYTEHLAEIIQKFLHKNKIISLDAVCSHGHTIKHRPEKGLTLQIGNLPKLYEMLGHTIVCDFRVQDVLLGGQGAPLVPVGDQLLFPQFDYCLNLGGFANISTVIEGERKAYDICAVNTVLNFLAGKLNLPYDEDGRLAASGEVIVELLATLNDLSFYSEKPPKSLGMEWVEREIIPLLDPGQPIPSLMKTYVLHAAEQISKEVGNRSKDTVLVTGGGAYNSFLIDELKKRTSAQICIPSEEVVNFKEALIFAFLGVLKLRGENNVLCSVTGASKDHSSGKIFRATNPD